MNIYNLLIIEDWLLFLKYWLSFINGATIALIFQVLLALGQTSQTPKGKEQGGLPVDRGGHVGVCHGGVCWSNTGSRYVAVH